MVDFKQELTQMSPSTPKEDKILSDDEEELDDPTEVKPWDEGGSSHCGYHESIHDTLMSVGASVHRVVGDPDEEVRTSLGAIGNWFQEASYAVRDIIRGENSEEMKEDASQAFNTILSVGTTIDEDDKKANQ
jgi:hypothetical protein